MANLLEEIAQLKKERDAILLAHNYVAGEIQDIADFSGDSLELSIRAKGVKNKVLLFAGVRFMAETAKLLSPQATVLLPNPDAGCPMADMASVAELKAMRQKHPDAIFVAYVNTTAATKALVDICCTSGNAEKIIAALPRDKEIVFLPDCNLGRNVAAKLQRPMIFWSGCCPIHNKVTPEMIAAARQREPEAPVLLHPECAPESVAAGDQALSTAGILRYAREFEGEKMIVGTERGIIHRLEKENPGKTFLPLEPPMICADMKKITLENLRDALKYMQHEIVLSPDIMREAVKPIEKMLALS